MQYLTVYGLYTRTSYHPSFIGVTRRPRRTYASLLRSTASRVGAWVTGLQFWGEKPYLVSLAQCTDLATARTIAHSLANKEGVECLFVP